MHIWTQYYIYLIICRLILLCHAFCVIENKIICNKANRAHPFAETTFYYHRHVRSGTHWVKELNAKLKRDNGRISEDKVEWIQQMEEEVLVSAQARIDQKKLQETLLTILLQSKDDRQDMDWEESASASGYYPATTRLQVSRWNVALAAGFSSFLFVVLIFHTPLPSLMSLVVITFVASRDPVMEEDGIGFISSFLGPVSRLLGYFVLGFLEKVYRKLYVITRAVWTDIIEIDSLQNQVESLEQTNRKLNVWIDQRQYVDEYVGNYSLDALRNLSRKNSLSVSGTKVQLMMRLLEKGVLEMDEPL